MLDVNVKYYPYCYICCFGSENNNWMWNMKYNETYCTHLSITVIVAGFVGAERRHPDFAAVSGARQPERTRSGEF